MQEEQASVEGTAGVLAAMEQYQGSCTCTL